MEPTGTTIICRQCRDTGVRYYPDPENGPEFDYQDFCTCPAGIAEEEKDWEESCRYQAWLSTLSAAEFSDHVDGHLLYPAGHPSPSHRG